MRFESFYREILCRFPELQTQTKAALQPWEYRRFMMFEILYLLTKSHKINMKYIQVVTILVFVTLSNGSMYMHPINKVLHNWLDFRKKGE